MKSKHFYLKQTTISDKKAWERCMNTKQKIMKDDKQNNINFHKFKETINAEKAR